MALKNQPVKMFVGFLSLILQSYLRYLLKSDSLTKTLTFKKVLIELRKIKSVSMSDDNEILIPLTKLQKTILNSLGFDPDLLYD